MLAVIGAGTLVMSLLLAVGSVWFISDEDRTPRAVQGDSVQPDKQIPDIALSTPRDLVEGGEWPRGEVPDSLSVRVFCKVAKSPLAARVSYGDSLVYTNLQGEVQLVESDGDSVVLFDARGYSKKAVEWGHLAANPQVGLSPNRAVTVFVVNDHGRPQAESEVFSIPTHEKRTWDEHSAADSMATQRLGITDLGGQLKVVAGPNTGFYAHAADSLSSIGRPNRSGEVRLVVRSRSARFVFERGDGIPISEMAFHYCADPRWNGLWTRGKTDSQGVANLPPGLLQMRVPGYRVTNVNAEHKLNSPEELVVRATESTTVRVVAEERSDLGLVQVISDIDQKPVADALFMNEIVSRADPEMRVQGALDATYLGEGKYQIEVPERNTAVDFKMMVMAPGHDVKEFRFYDLELSNRVDPYVLRVSPCGHERVLIVSRRERLSYPYPLTIHRVGHRETLGQIGVGELRSRPTCWSGLGWEVRCKSVPLASVSPDTLRESDHVTVRLPPPGAIIVGETEADWRGLVCQEATGGSFGLLSTATDSRFAPLPPGRYAICTAATTGLLDVLRTEGRDPYGVIVEPGAEVHVDGMELLGEPRAIEGRVLYRSEWLHRLYVRPLFLGPDGPRRSVSWRKRYPVDPEGAYAIPWQDERIRGVALCRDDAWGDEVVLDVVTKGVFSTGWGCIEIQVVSPDDSEERTPLRAHAEWAFDGYPLLRGRAVASMHGETLLIPGIPARDVTVYLLRDSSKRVIGVRVPAGSTERIRITM